MLHLLSDGSKAIRHLSTEAEAPNASFNYPVKGDSSAN